MYVGMQFSTFCWHVEDLFINSINYNHFGETKTWYVIPGHQKELFDDYVRQHYEGTRKKNLLEKITLMIDPLELIRAGIHIFKAHQRHRDYVLTFAKVPPARSRLIIAAFPMGTTWARRSTLSAAPPRK